MQPGTWAKLDTNGRTITNGNGVDMVNGTYHYLDLTPKGRDEAGLSFTQAWVRHHDKYDEPA